MQMSACTRVPVSLASLSRRLKAYPRLRTLCSFEIDTTCSAVYVLSTDALVEHIHALANETITERARDDDAQPDGINAGVSLKGSVLYPTAASDVKRLLPCIRHRIVEMWNETTSTYETDPKRIGILFAPPESSGQGNHVATTPKAVT